jgi:hypothetical protein
MAAFAINVLYCLIGLCVLVGVFYVVLWVLGKLGIDVPPKAVTIVWVIICLLILIWLIQALFGGGGMPFHFARG